MLWEKKHTGVVGTLIVCIALLMPGGVSQVAGETLVGEMEFLEVSEPKFLEVSEPESLKVSEPKSLQISEPISIKVSEPKSLESGGFLKGKYTPAKRENKAYLRCAKLKGFSAQHQCALDALGTSPEALD